MGRLTKVVAGVWLVGVTSALACGSSGGTDGNTSWLGPCAKSADCRAGLECVCGACTEACEAARDCASLATGAVCAPPAWSALRCQADAASGSVCTATCSGDQDCPSNAGCDGGFCWPTSHTPSGAGGRGAWDAAGGPDAGPSPDSSTDGGPEDASTDVGTDAGDAGAPLSSVRWLAYVDRDGEGGTERLRALRPTEPPLGPVDIIARPMVDCTSWSPDGAHLHYVGADGTGYIADVTPEGFGAGRAIGDVLGSSGCTPVWSPDGRYLANELHLWDVESDLTAPVWWYDGAGVQWGTLAWSGNGGHLGYRSTIDGVVTALDFTPEPPALPGGGTSWPDAESFTWSSTGARLVLGGAHGPYLNGVLPVTVVRDLGDRGTGIQRVGPEGRASAFLGWSPTGRDALWTLGDPLPVAYYVGRPGDDAIQPIAVSAASGSVPGALWSPDGLRVVTWNDVTASLLSIDGTLRTFGPFTAPAFCPTGERFAAIENPGPNQTVLVHSVTSGVTESIEVPGVSVESFVFSDSCDWLAFSGVGRDDAGTLLGYGTWSTRVGSGRLEPITSSCPTIHSWFPGEDRLLCYTDDVLASRLHAASPVAGDEAVTLLESTSGLHGIAWQPQLPERDSTPPRFAGCNAPRDVGSTTATLDWSPATDETPGWALRYEVTLTPTAGSLDAPPRAVQVRGATRVEITGLTPGTTYSVSCSATDLADNASLVDNPALTTPAEGSPPSFGGITGAVVDGTSATLSWAAATDDTTAPEGIRYLVYTATETGTHDFSSPLAVSLPGTTSVQLDGLTTNADHFFLVRAMDADGNVDTNRIELARHTDVSFRVDVLPLFFHGCAKSDCHSTQDPTVPPVQGLSLDPGAAYSNLVNVPSRGDPTVLRVDAASADPVDSYLWRKISGCCGVGTYSGASKDGVRDLTEAQKNTIRDWIVQGATSD